MTEIVIEQTIDNNEENIIITKYIDGVLIEHDNICSMSEIFIKNENLPALITALQQLNENPKTK